MSTVWAAESGAVTVVMKMKIEKNTIARDWTVLHDGRRFCVNFTESDGQTLVLLN